MPVATGPIATFGSITGGSGYANGTYPGVQLTGGNGSGALATLTVVGGAVTAVAFSNPSAHQQLDRTGKNYQVADSLSALPSFDGVGSGSGFHVAVATLAAACENCVFGKIVPLSAPAAVQGLRYCGYDAFVNNQKPATSFQPNNLNTWLSNVTSDDYWCGDGADLSSKVSFSAGVSAIPSTAFPGLTTVASPGAGVASFTFNLPGNFSKFFATAGNATAATFEASHGVYVIPLDPGVSAAILSGDGSNFAGTETWYVLGMP
ncbi:MAG TPA: hypothetical protein VF748_17455 [Candidatus Acidoferrum sp.]